MIIQGHDPRLRWPRTLSPAENSNFSPATGRVICRELCRYDLCENPYPTVAERGAEIERLLRLPAAVLRRMGLDRDEVVRHVLNDILHDKSYSGINR